MHGVNLGNWLVVERWMNKRLFEGLEAVDELSLMQTTEGKQRLQDHRSTYISEEDIQWLAESGVELLRLPIGFWTIQSDDIAYVDWLFEMAEKYGMNVMICLHGAPGSQNGYDHSGQKGAMKWFEDKTLQIETIALLKKVAERYNHSRAFWGLELLNEPTLNWKNYWILRRFYQQAYQALKKVLRPGVYTIFSDSYHPLLMMGMLRGSTQHPVAMDIHWYSFATWWPKKHTATQHMRRIRWRQWVLRITQWVQPVVIGEWSAILPLEKVSRVGLEELEREYLQLQRDIYKNALAECYWSYKTAAKSSWNFRHVTEEPQ